MLSKRFDSKLLNKYTNAYRDSEIEKSLFENNIP